MRVISSMCCTKRQGACLDKDVKHASPSAKGFRSIFDGIQEHQKGYLVYVPSTRKIISSYDDVFDKIFLLC